MWMGALQPVLKIWHIMKYLFNKWRYNILNFMFFEDEISGALPGWRLNLLFMPAISSQFWLKISVGSLLSSATLTVQIVIHRFNRYLNSTYYHSTRFSIIMCIGLCAIRFQTAQLKNFAFSLIFIFVYVTAQQHVNTICEYPPAETVFQQGLALSVFACVFAWKTKLHYY